MWDCEYFVDQKGFCPVKQFVEGLSRRDRVEFLFRLKKLRAAVDFSSLDYVKRFVDLFAICWDHRFVFFYVNDSTIVLLHALDGTIDRLHAGVEQANAYRVFDAGIGR
jgi:hypothetical protein